ncbi:hypothetical protein [Clostridium polynesiense]|uniref:hypothetical protein n=1 Tax=Clostridium polynesiense TaxID=1325933 RepID=UPI0009E558A3|nr:hypothetical protein [Clostridium polynesiense]
MQNELKATTKELNTKSSSWHKLSESMNKAGDTMKKVGEKMTSAGTKLTAAVTLPILGIGTATTKMAMDAVESESLFEVSMGAMADQARIWSDKISNSLGLNSYNVRNSMATYNAMLTSMGLVSEEALDMSQGLTELSYDMASFYNLNPEEAFNKLKSGISGEAEPLKALGILVNENTVKTYAYTHGIAENGEALTEAQKVQARYGVIMEATKNAQGDLARTIDSPTNKIRAMKEQAQEMGVQFGQILIPILEKLISVIKPLMDRFQGLSKEQQETIVKVGLIVAAIGPVILVIGKVITIIGTLSGIISTASAAIAAAGSVSAALGAAFTSVIAPVGIVIGIIAGLIGIGVLLYKNWDTIKNTISSVWDWLRISIGNSVSAIKDSIKSAWESVKLVCMPVIESIANTIKSIWEGVRASIAFLWELIKAIFLSAWTVISSIVQTYINIVSGIISVQWQLIEFITTKVWNAISSVISAVLNSIILFMRPVIQMISTMITSAWNVISTVTSIVFNGVFSYLRATWSTISSTLASIWNGIRTVCVSVWNSISAFFSSIWNTIADVFNQVTSNIKNIVAGAWNNLLGITTSMWNSIKDALSSPISAAANFIKGQLDKIKGFFNALNIKLPHIKLPHFKIEGEFSLAPPKVPRLAVNWYASGGIFNSPGIIGVGEAGSEAVLPIDRLDELMAKAIEKVNGNKGNGGLTIKIENFINNTEKDIEQLAYELEFYRQRVATGRGEF